MNEEGMLFAFIVHRSHFIVSFRSLVTCAMAFASIANALAQYNSNLGWGSPPSISSAQAALQAVQYLLVNRATRTDDRGQSINYASLESEKKALENFLGSTVPRGLGRSREVRHGFAGRESIE